MGDDADEALEDVDLLLGRLGRAQFGLDLFLKRPAVVPVKRKKVIKGRFDPILGPASPPS
jgi:hypothetical protein